MGASLMFPFPGNEIGKAESCGVRHCAPLKVNAFKMALHALVLQHLGK